MLSFIIHNSKSIYSKDVWKENRISKLKTLKEGKIILFRSERKKKIKKGPTR